VGALVLGLFAPSPRAHADTIRVPKDAPTIQAGIDAAVDGDTVLVAPGVYTGPGNRDLSLWGKAITLKSTDGPQMTIIDAQGSRSSIHRGFFLRHGETQDSVIEGFTITGGYVIGDTGGTGPHGGGGGGGIFIRESSPTIRNCIISSNVSASDPDPLSDDGKGGGVYINDLSNPAFENCLIVRNGSGNRGGGVASSFSGTSLTFRNCLIMQNSCGAKFSGAGMFITGKIALINCTVAHNLGVVNVSGLGELTIRNSILWGETASPQFVAREVPGQDTVILFDHCDVEGGLRSIVITGGAKVMWENTNIDLDPLFIDPRQQDVHLGPGSPCIDAGQFHEDEAGRLDLDGQPRIQNCRIDMGAYESPYFADCNLNRLPDACEVMEGHADDCADNGIPDECEPDSDKDAIVDSCDNCLLPNPRQEDCQPNGIGDVCDLADGTSSDWNHNEIPDECEPDVDDDGVPDDVDNCSLPNSDQLDCQPDGSGDVCDLAYSSSSDCNLNFVPDECDIAGGASNDVWPPQGDGIPDDCQADCNANQNPDIDDITAGTSPDADGNLVPDECQCIIVSSDPRDGAIDARQPFEIDGSSATGWNRLELTMCDEAMGLVSSGQFEVVASSGMPAPAVQEIIVDGSSVSVVLSGPIPPGECTTIRHVPSDTRVRLGYLPGDASGTGVTSAIDILKLVDHLNGVLPVPMQEWQCDINRSGTCEPQDILRLIDLLNGAGVYEPWDGVHLPLCP
jgi:hypothetical protein